MSKSVSIDMEMTERMAGPKHVRLDVVEEESPSSSRGSSNSSLSESVLVPGSMPSSFQVESPRKVPKRKKKRSIHFSQLEKRNHKSVRRGFNRTSLVLLGFNLITVAALIFVVLSKGGAGGDAAQGGKSAAADSSDEYVNLDGRGALMEGFLIAYLNDLAGTWENFRDTFAPPAFPTQPKVSPSWDMGVMRDDQLQYFMPSLAPAEEPDQIFVDPTTNQAMTVYERIVNLTLTTQTLCYFTNYAIGSFLQNPDHVFKGTHTTAPHTRACTHTRTQQSPPLPR